MIFSANKYSLLIIFCIYGIITISAEIAENVIYSTMIHSRVFLFFGGYYMEQYPSFEIIDYIGVLGKNRNGWTYELNQVSWNGKPPMYDIRAWSPDHETPGKGISLNEQELKTLYKLLKRECGFLTAEE